MKKILALSIFSLLFSVHIEAQESYITEYGNGIYCIAADLYGQLPNIGSRLAQFKQSHPDCFITAMSSLNGRFGTVGYMINCERRK